MSDSRVGVGDELVMRTFRCNAPIIIGAGALVVSLFAPAPSLLKAEDRQAAAEAAFENRRVGLGDRSDRVAARRALELALSELGDGVTLVWRRPERGLVGRIRPVSAFRDENGRVCRTVVYALALGNHQREIEGVACRERNGSWSLSG